MRKILFTFLAVLSSVFTYAEDYYYVSGNLKYHITTTALDDEGNVDATGFMSVDSILAKTIYRAMEKTGQYQMSNFYYSTDGKKTSVITYKSEYEKETEGKTFDASLPWPTYKMVQYANEDRDKGCYYICGISYMPKKSVTLSDVKYIISSVGELGGMTRMSSVPEATAKELCSAALSEISKTNPDAKFYYNYDGTKYSYMGTDGVTHTTNDAALEGGRYIYSIDLVSGNTVKVGAVTYKIGIAGNNNRLPGICELKDIKAVSNNGGQYQIENLNKSVLNGLVYAKIVENEEGTYDTTYCVYGGSEYKDKNMLLGKKYLCGYTIDHTLNFRSLGQTSVDIHYKKYGQWNSGKAYYYNKQQKLFKYVKRQTAFWNNYNDHVQEYGGERTAYGAGNLEDALHNDSVKNMLKNLVYKDFPESESKDDEGNITKAWDITYKDPTNKRKEGIYTISDDVRKFDDVPQAIRDYCKTNMKNEESDSVGTKLVNKIRNAFDFVIEADVDSICEIDALLDNYYETRARVSLYADTCSYAQAPSIFGNAITGPDAMISSALGFASNIKNVGTGTAKSLIVAAITALEDIESSLKEGTKSMTEDELSIISAVSASSITTSKRFPTLHEVKISKLECAKYFIAPASSTAEHVVDLVTAVLDGTAAISACAASLGGQGGIASAVASMAKKIVTATANLAFDVMWNINVGQGISQVYSTASWLNYQCQNSESAHAYLSDALQACRLALTSAATNKYVTEARSNLTFAMNRAKAMNALAPVQNDMTYRISEYTEIANNMETLTNTAETPHYAKGNLRQAIAWAQNEKDQIREYDILYDGSLLSSAADVQYTDASSSVYPSNRLKKAMSILTQAKDIFTRQYAIEQVYEEATDSIKSATFQWADPKQRMRMARIAANRGLTKLNNISIENSDATVKKLNALYICADTTYTNLSNKRHEAIARYKQLNDTLAYVTNLRDNLKYYSTDTALTNYINDYVAYAKKETDSVLVNTAMHDIIVKSRYVANHDDMNSVYLLFVIDAAEKWYAVNMEKMSPYQRNIYLKALNMAEVVLKEYNSDYHDPSPERYYYAIWALDYAIQMKPSKDPTVDYRAQLTESLAVVANYLSARYEVEIPASSAAVYAEAMAVYNSMTSSDDELAAAKAKIDALMEGESTAIKDVKSQTKSAADGKYLLNGKFVIVKGGKQFNAAGAMMK